MEYEIIDGQRQQLRVNMKAGESLYVNALLIREKSDNVVPVEGAVGLLTKVRAAVSGTSLLKEMRANGSDGYMVLGGDIMSSKVYQMPIESGKTYFVNNLSFVCAETSSKIDEVNALTKSSSMAKLVTAPLNPEVYQRGGIGYATGLGSANTRGTGVLLSVIGPGNIAFIARGNIKENSLDGNEMSIDFFHLVAFDSSLDYKWGANPLTPFIATFKGKGKVVTWG